METGLVMVMGKLPLDPLVRREAPPAVFKGPTLVLGPGGCSMFAGAVEYPPSQGPAYDSEEYVMWAFSAHRLSAGSRPEPSSGSPICRLWLRKRAIDGWLIASNVNSIERQRSA